MYICNMGGCALKNTETRRYQREEYDALEAKMLAKLREDFSQANTPRFFHNKESFGDMDILISTDGFNRNMREYIETEFQPNEIFHNGNCWSFDVEGLQIDLITTSGANYQAYLNYLSFNDLGNFIGRIAQKLGLKYGQEGLWYLHQFKGQKIAKIIVSQDLEKIYTFLGLQYNEWVKGFNELEDIFEFVATSPYFDADSFQLKNLNRVNRERNFKRKSYMLFLDWIEKNASDRSYHFEADTSKYLEYIESYFPESNLTKEIRKAEYERTRALYVQSKFNGGEVMKRFNLQGKELGDALKKFRDYIELNHNFDDYIINYPEEHIYRTFEAVMKGERD